MSHWHIFLKERKAGTYEVCVSYPGAPRGGERFLRRLPPDFSDLLRSERSGAPKRNWRRAPSGKLDDALLFCAADLDTLKEIGASLHAALFEKPRGAGKDLTRTFLALRETAAQQGTSFGVDIDLTEAPRLARVPWEALYLPSDDLFLGIDARSNIVRLLSPDQLGGVPPDVSPPIRMLVAVANPEGELEAGAELADIQRRVSNLLEASSSRYDVQTLPAATRSEFGNRIEDWKPHIVHFIGHGGFDDDKGLIYFHQEADPRKRDPIDSATLRDLVRNDRPWLVVLNSCLGGAAARADPFGGAAQNLLRVNVPFVVAMQSPISDEAAVRFSQRFYASLMRGDPVATAVTRGRNAIRSLGTEALRTELITPVLYSTGQAERIPITSEAPLTARHDQPIEQRDWRQQFREVLPTASNIAAIVGTVVAIIALFGVGADRIAPREPEAAALPERLAPSGSFRPAESAAPLEKKQQEQIFRFENRLRPPLGAPETADWNPRGPSVEPAAAARRERPNSDAAIATNPPAAHTSRDFRLATSARTLNQIRSRARAASNRPAALVRRQAGPAGVAISTAPSAGYEGVAASSMGFLLGAGSASLLGALAGSGNVQERRDSDMIEAAMAGSHRSLATTESLAFGGMGGPAERTRPYPLYFPSGEVRLTQGAVVLLEHVTLWALNGAKVHLSPAQSVTPGRPLSKLNAWRLASVAAFLRGRGVPADALAVTPAKEAATIERDFADEPDLIQIDIVPALPSHRPPAAAVASYAEGSAEPAAFIAEPYAALRRATLAGELALELTGYVGAGEDFAKPGLAQDRVDAYSKVLERRGMTGSSLRKEIGDKHGGAAQRIGLARRVDARVVLNGAEEIDMPPEATDVGGAVRLKLDRLSAWLIANERFSVHLGAVADPGLAGAARSATRVAGELQRRGVNPAQIVIGPSAASHVLTHGSAGRGGTVVEVSLLIPQAD